MNMKPTCNRVYIHNNFPIQHTVPKPPLSLGRSQQLAARSLLDIIHHLGPSLLGRLTRLGRALLLSVPTALASRLSRHVFFVVGFGLHRWAGFHAAGGQQWKTKRANALHVGHEFRDGFLAKFGICALAPTKFVVFLALVDGCQLDLHGISHVNHTRQGTYLFQVILLVQALEEIVECDLSLDGVAG